MTAVDLRRVRRIVELVHDLAGEERAEVLARPPSAAYQLRAFVRRHRAASAAVAAILLVSVAAAAVSLHWAWRSRTAERLATRRFEEVRGLARSVLFELHGAIESLPGATEARRVLAAKALEYLDALERDAGDDAGLLGELVEGRIRLGEALGAPGLPSLGDLAAGERELERALATSERLCALDGGVRPRLLRARAQLALSSFARDSGDPARAAELARAARDACDGVAESDPQHDAADRIRIDAEERLAKALRLLGRSDEARALLESAIERRRTQRPLQPDERELLASSAIGLVELAILHVQGARPAEATPLLDEALAAAEELAARRPADARATELVANVLTWRGTARAELGEHEAALADHARAIELRRDLSARDPSNSTALADLSFACEKLGEAHLADSDPEGALAAHEEALALSQRRLGLHPSGFEERLAAATGELHVAEVLELLGRADEARAARESAIGTLRELQVLRPESLEVPRRLGAGLARLGDDARHAARHEEALATYAEASAFIERAAAGDPGHAWTRRMVMVLRCWRGVTAKAAAEAAEGDAARAYYEQAVVELGATLAEEPSLAAAGFLEPGDARACELVRADLAACREALGEVPGAEALPLR